MRNLDRYVQAEAQIKITRKDAIRLRCLDCCGNQQGEVKRCTAYLCPLWPFRMGSKFEPVPAEHWTPHEIPPASQRPESIESRNSDNSGRFCDLDGSTHTTRPDLRCPLASP